METILVVDDQADVLTLARDILQDKGYRILEAGDAEEALQIAHAHAEPIHLLLTDVVMPGINGRQLAERLGRERPEMKVLYMSGFTLVLAHHEMLEAGPELDAGTPIIAKPFSVDGLIQKVREVLESRAPARSPFARARAGHESRPDPWWP